MRRITLSLLPKIELKKHLETMTDWSFENDTIKKEFNFDTYMNSIAFINQLAERSEKNNHHPDMHLTGYRNVEIVLFTHSLGGISLNDIAMAKMIDEEVSFNYSPKWLRENPAAKKD